MELLPRPLPLLTPQSDVGRSRKALSRAFAAGELVRIRQGFYAETEPWFAAAAEERFMTTVKAVAARLHQPVFTGPTALFLRGLPLLEVPAHVDVVTMTASRAGLQTTMPGYHEGHLRRAETLPYLHRTLHHFAERQPAAEPVIVPEVGTPLRVTDLVDNLAQSLPGLGFAGALVVVDSLLSGRNGQGVRLETRQRDALVSPERPAPHTPFLWRVLSEATDLAESAGESLSRARMTELGFELPELQVIVQGADGADYRLDFRWRELGLAGEFDGRMKYGLAGPDPSEAAEILWREKRREDALRQRGIRFLRWTWEDVVDPDRFAELLVRAGVPRRRRASIRLGAGRPGRHGRTPDPAARRIGRPSPGAK